MILESQFPELPEFQLTVCTEALQNVHPAEEWLVFFHNFCNHLVVSQLSQGRFHLYDSLQPKENRAWTAKATCNPLWPCWKWKRAQSVDATGPNALQWLLLSLLYSQKEMRGHLEDYSITSTNALLVSWCVYGVPTYVIDVASCTPMEILELLQFSDSHYYLPTPYT